MNKQEYLDLIVRGYLASPDASREEELFQQLLNEAIEAYGDEEDGEDVIAEYMERNGAVAKAEIGRA